MPHQPHDGDAFDVTGGSPSLYHPATENLLAAQTFLGQSCGLDGEQFGASYAGGGFQHAYPLELARQTAVLAGWAKKKGLWLSSERFEQRRRGGEEHEILPLGDPVERILRLTRNGFFGVRPCFDERVVSGRVEDHFLLRPGTPYQYLCRLAAQNALFRELNLMDERLNSLEGFTEMKGRLVAVTSQPFFNGIAATEGKIAAFFRDANFLPVCPGAWYRPDENLAVFDANPNNVLECDETLIPFDVIPLHPGKAWAGYLKQLVGKAGV